MKKLLISVVSLLIAAQVGAQTKAAADAAKVLDKAKTETQNPKKASNPATWLKLSNAYVQCYDAPVSGLLLGTSQMETKILLKDQQILSSGQEEINGKMFFVDKYEDKVLYYDEKGQLVTWNVIKPVVDNALVSSYEALNKAAELDTKGSQKKNISAALAALKTKFYDDAISNYTLGHNSEASKGFEKAFDIAAHPLIGQVDSMMAYYTGVTATMAGENARAIKFFEYCLSINYDQQGDVYATLADNYKVSGDTAKAKEVLAAAFTKYPTSQAVLVALINIYLESNDDPEKVLSILKLAQKNEPTNASLFYAEGSVYKKLNKFEEAIACYNTSAKIDPKYVFAPFAAGCAYYDWAVAIQEKAQMEMDDNKFMEMQKQMEESLDNAIAPFEKAFEMTTEKDIKLACAEYLKNIYFRFRDKDEASKASYEKYNSYVEQNK